jgi:tetratricopeptide (TPR) repeat protein
MLAVFVVYLLHASIDWMWESTAVSVLAFGAIAVVGSRLSGDRFRFPLPLRLVAALVATGFGILQLPGLLSTSEIRHSQAAERAGNASLALAWARDAVSAEPWSASAHEQEGLVLESAGRLRQAGQELSEAISDEPFNYRHWLIRSRIETELGHLPAALYDYALARELRPHAEVFALAAYFKATRATAGP